MTSKTYRKKLENETLNKLKDIKNKLDPRTYSSYEKNIYQAVGVSALNKLQNKFTSILNTNDNKITKTGLSKQKNKENKIINQQAIEYLKQPKKTFYVKSNVEIMYTYNTGNRKSRYTKNGRIKGQIYDNSFKLTNKNDILKSIQARSSEEAEKIYIRLINSEYGIGGIYGVDTLVETSRSIRSISNVSVTLSNGSGTIPSQMMMRKYEPLKYNFIQSDDKFLSNPGFCVPDQFVNTYSKYIKKLTLDYFIDLCYKVRGEDRTVEIKKSLLDYDLKDDDEDNKDKKWDISQGVSPEMLKKYVKN